MLFAKVAGKATKRMVSVLLIAACIIPVLSGCGKKSILQEKDAQYKLVSLNDYELQNNVYYIKDGTKFYATYMPQNNGLNSGNSNLLVSPDRFAWLQKDYSLLPTLYKDEIIAYASPDYEISGIQLERLQYCGFSFGFFGGAFDSEGYYEIDKGSLIKDTDAAAVFNKYSSSTIKIISIDGEPISPDMINATGLFQNIEEDSIHKFEIFAGTKYDTVSIKADYMYFVSYELYNMNNISTTKNGYVAISMPEGAKSGFYFVDGKGMFKYCDFKKGEESEDKILSNESYYQTEEEKLSLYSQQYSVNIKQNTKNVTFTVNYEEGQVDKNSIYCILLAPDETRYIMEADTTSASITLDTASAGRWTLNISPKNLVVTDINVVSDDSRKDAYSVEYYYELEEAETNYQFWASFIGEGEVWGTVENKDGKTQSMDIIQQYAPAEYDSEGEEKIKETEGIISVVYPYIPAGTYKMTIYHYEDTMIKEDGHNPYTGNLETEIITIEE